MSLDTAPELCMEIQQRPSLPRPGTADYEELPQYVEKPPRRFNLTPRCVVWDLEEVEVWIEARKKASRSGGIGPAPGPDEKQRRHRPVHTLRNQLKG